MDGLHNTPLLHIHGEKDPVINIHHADLYKEKRRHADAPSKFITLPEGDHDFANRPDQLAAIAETVEWFKSTL